MNAWWIILAVGLGTYAIRASMFALVSVKPLPVRFQSALTLVGPAAVAALVATIMLTSAGSVAPEPPAELAAVVAGLVAVHCTGNVLHAFAVGMPAFWLLTPLLG